MYAVRLSREKNLFLLFCSFEDCLIDGYSFKESSLLLTLQRVYTFALYCSLYPFHKKQRRNKLPVIPWPASLPMPLSKRQRRCNRKKRRTLSWLQFCTPMEPAVGCCILRTTPLTSRGISTTTFESFRAPNNKVWYLWKMPPRN
jgi:hypothetical protein